MPPPIIRIPVVQQRSGVPDSWTPPLPTRTPSWNTVNPATGMNPGTFSGGMMMLPTPTPGQAGYGTAVEQAISAKYPFMAAFMNHPEVGPLLRRAAELGWGEAELYGAVQNTSWWQSTSAAARQWELLVAEDPAEAGRLSGQTASTMFNRAKSLGVDISGGQIQSLAMTATKNGWTDAQVVDQLLQSVNWASVQGGDLTALRDSVKQVAGNYLVAVSDQTAQQYAMSIASGEMSEAGVVSIMQRQSKDRFGWMAEQIDQGVTPSQYFAPIRDVIARELEVAPDAVDLMDPKWMGMIERPGDDGAPRAATMNEARLAARRDTRWQHTQGAQELMAKAAAGVSDVFGRRPI